MLQIVDKDDLITGKVLAMTDRYRELNNFFNDRRCKNFLDKVFQKVFKNYRTSKESDHLLSSLESDEELNDEAMQRILIAIALLIKVLPTEVDISKGFNDLKENILSVLKMDLEEEYLQNLIDEVKNQKI